MMGRTHDYSPRGETLRPGRNKKPIGAAARLAVKECEV